MALSVGVVLLSGYLFVMRWLEYRAVRALIQSLSEEKEESFDTAMQAVKRFGNGRLAVQPLIESFQSKNAEGVRRAKDALVQLREVSAQPVIETLADTTQDVDCRVNAAWTLGWLKDQKALPVLVATLADDNPKVRRLATWALAGYAPASRVALPRLRELAHDPDADQRYMVALALSALGEDARDAMPELMTLLKDSRCATRSYAAGALGKFGPDSRDAVPDLIALLTDEEFFAQRIAIVALGEIGPDARAALPKLIECLEHENDIRVYTAEAIERIDPETALRLGL